MPATLKDQLDFEVSMSEQGISRFFSNYKKNLEKERFDSTSAGNKIIVSYLLQISEYIENYLKKGPQRNKYAEILKVLPTDVLAYIFCINAVNCVFKNTYLGKVIISLGRQIEDEIRFSKFEDAKPGLYAEIQRAADKRKSVSPVYRRIILSLSMKDNGIPWTKWNNETLRGVGALLLKLGLESSDFITRHVIKRRNRARAVLRGKPELEEFIKQHNEYRSILLPFRMPCLVIPNEWTSPYSGGYFSPRLRKTTRLVRTRIGKEGQEQRKRIASARMPEVLSAANTLQETGWRINTPVFRVAQRVLDNNLEIGVPRKNPIDMPKCPIPKEKNKEDLQKKELQEFMSWKKDMRALYAKEEQRKGQMYSVHEILKSAQELLDKEEFYYVYQLDFRGRFYSVSHGTTPQGADLGKGFLKFKRAEPLGERGLRALELHGANKYGNDKIPNRDRLAWIRRNREKWIQVAKYPLSNLTYWKDADKPYQFLAFCYEYAMAIEEGPSFCSSLPISVDGTCNGLQHFAAMLKDENAGKNVNLIPSQAPQDIYSSVSTAVWRKILKLVERNFETGQMLGNFVKCVKDLGEEELPRSFCKKPVMTLPYGSTKRTCIVSVQNWCEKNGLEHRLGKKPFATYVLLANILWSSMMEQIQSAMVVMEWLQNVAAILTKKNYPVEYKTRLGFPVYQGVCKAETTRVRLRVGNKNIEVQTRSPGSRLSLRKQMQGISPNFVHSLDATHLAMCVNSGRRTGIRDFAVVHDDFGVHASNMDKFQKIIREEFVNLYKQESPLQKLKSDLESSTGLSLPPLPESGNLRIEQVLDSEYFFS